MKSSHFQTPRTLDECEFQYIASPNMSDKITDRGHAVVVIIGVVVLAIFSGLYIGGLL